MRGKILLFTVLCFLLGTKGNAQKFETVMDTQGVKILKGAVSIATLANEPTFSWYGDNYKKYTPKTEAIETLKKHKDDIYLLLFGGTWCSDTHAVLPQYISWIEAAAFPENHLTIIGVDRNKESLDNLPKTLNITNIPTMLVYKNGREIGRIIEFGETGSPVDETVQMIKKAE